MCATQTLRVNLKNTAEGPDLLQHRDEKLEQLIDGRAVIRQVVPRSST